MSNNKDIIKKYKSGKLRIVFEQARYPVKEIKPMLVSGNYKMRLHTPMWSVDVRSRLIESFIINAPVPPICLYEYDYSKFEVIDGLEVLATIGEFYNDWFALEDLEFWQELEGMTYSQLPEEIRRGIDRRYLSAIVLLKETTEGGFDVKALKSTIYERLNLV